LWKSRGVEKRRFEEEDAAEDERPALAMSGSLE